MLSSLVARVSSLSQVPRLLLRGPDPCDVIVGDRHCLHKIFRSAMPTRVMQMRVLLHLDFRTPNIRSLLH